MPAKISIDALTLKNRRPGLQLRDVDVRSFAGNTALNGWAFKSWRENAVLR
jgi:hypothetical protein